MSGLTIEPILDSPGPRAGVVVDGLDASGPSRVTLWRSSPGGKRRPVRGWRNRLVYGADYVEDAEVPLGRPVTYELQVISGAVIPDVVAAVVSVPSEVGYIQDPLLPLGMIPVTNAGDLDAAASLTNAAFAALQYEVEQSVTSILGSDERVALTGQRLAMSGVDFSVLTEAAEQSTALRNLLRSTALVLVRPLPSWGPLPDVFYTVPAVAEMPSYDAYGATLTTWQLTGDQVAPPSINIIVPIWTYADVEALWATYADQQAAAVARSATYLDDLRDPSLGGA